MQMNDWKELFEELQVKVVWNGNKLTLSSNNEEKIEMYKTSFECFLIKGIGKYDFLLGEINLASINADQKTKRKIAMKIKKILEEETFMGVKCSNLKKVFNINDMLAKMYVNIFFGKELERKNLEEMILFYYSEKGDERIVSIRRYENENNIYIGNESVENLGKLLEKIKGKLKK